MKLPPLETVKRLVDNRFVNAAETLAPLYQRMRWEWARWGADKAFIPTELDVHRMLTELLECAYAECSHDGALSGSCGSGRLAVKVWAPSEDGGEGGVWLALDMGQVGFEEAYALTPEQPSPDRGGRPRGTCREPMSQARKDAVQGGCGVDGHARWTMENAGRGAPTTVTLSGRSLGGPTSESKRPAGNGERHPLEPVSSPATPPEQQPPSDSGSASGEQTT